MRVSIGAFHTFSWIDLIHPFIGKKIIMKVTITCISKLMINYIFSSQAHRTDKKYVLVKRSPAKYNMICVAASLVWLKSFWTANYEGKVWVSKGCISCAILQQRYGYPLWMSESCENSYPVSMQTNTNQSVKVWLHSLLSIPLGNIATHPKEASTTRKSTSISVSYGGKT